MRSNAFLVVAAIAAICGFTFAAVSTHDFVQHLDRQVHGLHCSFLPGLDQTDVSGSSGCHVTLMSPYSSVMRESVWGGIPVSLPAMAVFAFLGALAIALIALGRQREVRATGFALAAWGLPVLTSIGMGYLSLATLGAACKLCIGIYASSGVGFLATLGAFLTARGLRKARAQPAGAADATVKDPSPPVHEPLGIAFGIGVVFVLVPVGVYAASAPDFSRYVGACGTLADGSDPHDVLIPIGTQLNPVPVIEVLDPLCPACKGFEARFAASSIEARASRRVLLFPLDDTCNWMIDHALHPGACAISEAVLCAEGEADRVIEWAFENQEAITSATREDPGAAARMARSRFPALASCIGSPRVQARLNQSLRWAVQNQLPVLTPQVYVGDARLCDADTDLGMDFALSRLVDRYHPSPRTSSAPATVETPRAARPAVPSTGVPSTGVPSTGVPSTGVPSAAAPAADPSAATPTAPSAEAAAVAAPPAASEAAPAEPAPAQTPDEIAGSPAETPPEPVPAPAAEEVTP
jgi:uncharacterized membrane protein